MEEAEKTRGKGELQSDLLAEQSDVRDMTRKDIGLLNRAIRQRWAIPADVQEEAVKRLKQIIHKPVVRVMTVNGPEPLDGPADANAVRAAAVLTQMTAQNQADDHLADKNARLDAGQATERLSLEPVLIREAIRPKAG